jgi:fructose-specific phosphotransferase system IIC component
MIDTNMLAPAVIVFGSFFVLGLLIEHASGRKRAQRQKEAYARSGDSSVHSLIDDSPSFGALMLAILLWCIGAYVATALLFFQSNFLWAFTLFH